MTGERADLHVHTTFSDGCLSPTAVVQRAAELGLRAVAITDHDAVGGVEEALRAGERFGVTVVPGVEISAGLEGREVHILGFCVDHQHPPLLNLLKHSQAVRVKRVERILDRLEHMGIHLDYDYVMALGGAGAVGRPHIAKALVEYGYVGSEAEAFETLIGDGCPGYVPRERVSPQEAIGIIHQAGGVAGWAHPGVERHDEWLDSFVAMGLDALEIVHPDHSREDVARYRDLAARFGLVATGGSDFHGCDRAGHQLMGRYTVAWEQVLQLQDRASSRRCQR